MDDLKFGFDIYEPKAVTAIGLSGVWRWRLFDLQGKPIAMSTRSYPTREEAWQAICLVHETLNQLCGTFVGSRPVLRGESKEKEDHAAAAITSDPRDERQ